MYISGGYSLTLNGDNTFSGGLTVDSAATLYLTGNNAFATGGVAVNNGSTLYLTGNNAFTGGVTVNNGSTLQISGNNTFTGGVTINGGSSVQVGSAGALNASGANAVTFTGTAGTLSLRADSAPPCPASTRSAPFSQPPSKISALRPQR